MESPLILNPETNSDRSIESRRKKKKLSNPRRSQNQNQMRWNSPAEQQNYSSKLIEALRQVRRNRNPSASLEAPTAAPSSSSNSPSRAESVPRGGRAVREAADRALAIAAKGRTRWSRAILKSRLKLKFKKRRIQRVAAVAGDNPSKRRAVSVIGLNLKEKKRSTGAQVQRKIRVLGRLVPGCRKLSLPNLLEETTDYVAALKMQIRAMTALTNLLSVSSAGASPIDRVGSTQPPTQS
ncbi:transcription factor bHLH147-like [Telopea speciosissima]|uniref:transcription factor bHLH147-like n=1 Tax=Telopea speciosissima TaxID=54955 RepID=UPI001CC5A599|nr:transcription factor bHLH147-like [Telopea speciosissima]